jgi:NDP-sugar pyrophosphorylase family protein
LVSPQQKSASPSLKTLDSLILCGGLGTRLLAVVQDRPKGLAMISGRPFLDILVEDLLRQGLRRLILCVGHGADQIVAHFRGRTDAEFVFSIENEPLGTGGALRHALAHVRSDPVAVLNGDSFCPVSYGALLAFHEERKSQGTIVVTAPAGRRDVGAIALGADGRLLSFAEKSERPHESEKWVNAGIYILRRTLIESIPQGKASSLERDVIPRAIAAGDAYYGFRASGPLIDIGTPERYAAAQEQLRPPGTVVKVPVSVVVPCFRCAETIARAIRSVHGQTQRPQEVIVVDDASDDETPQELARLEQEFGGDWLRLIRLPRNQGPSTARNDGWDAARGDFIAFLDADDTWHPRKIEYQYRLMRADPGIALSAHRHSFRELPPVASTQARATEVTAAALRWRNRFVTPSVMVKRDLPFRFREGQRHMEDHLLWMQIAFAGYRIVILERALAALHKKSFGEAGLSSQLLEMERSELANYRLLGREKHIGRLMLAVLQCWSVAKFLRRVLIVALRRLLALARQKES